MTQTKQPPAIPGRFKPGESDVFSIVAYSPDDLRLKIKHWQQLLSQSDIQEKSQINSVLSEIQDYWDQLQDEARAYMNRRDVEFISNCIEFIKDKKRRNECEYERRIQAIFASNWLSNLFSLLDTSAEASPYWRRVIGKDSCYEIYDLKFSKLGALMLQLQFGLPNTSGGLPNMSVVAKLTGRLLDELKPSSHQGPYILSDSDKVNASAANRSIEAAIARNITRVRARADADLESSLINAKLAPVFEAATDLPQVPQLLKFVIAYKKR